MNITIDDGERTSGDPRVRREDVVSQIAAREHAQIIADNVRDKLERYINLEIFSTEKDDHTKSLSERVTHLEREFGEMRRIVDSINQWTSRQQRIARMSWWRRLIWSQEP
jgi:hypothetical protein